MRLLFGGDVMLGRIVRQYMASHGSNYPLAGVAQCMAQADLTVVNLECAITASERIWPGAPKAFYFGAAPPAAAALCAAGVDLVSLANNHTLDFGTDGLADTLRLLDTHGIGHAGAGANLDQARAPAFLEHGGLRIGMVAYCDHQEDFAATADRPGILYLNLNDEQNTLAYWQSDLQELQQAQVDWPILSLHWGPNMAWRPSPWQRRLAHAALDMGWRIVFGHSAHVCQGIELYRGGAIIYAAGDLIDDYYVDPVFKNDHGTLIECVLGRDRLEQIRLYPTHITECRTQLAAGEEFDYVAAQIKQLCAEMDTSVWRAGRRLWIDVRNEPARANS